MEWDGVGVGRGVLMYTYLPHDETAVRMMLFS